MPTTLAKSIERIFAGFEKSSNADSTKAVSTTYHSIPACRTTKRSPNTYSAAAIVFKFGAPAKNDVPACKSIDWRLGCDCTRLATYVGTTAAQTHHLPSNSICATNGHHGSTRLVDQTMVAVGIARLDGGLACDLTFVAASS